MTASDGTGTGKGALITGASAGLGEAFARLLASEGHDLMLVARRADRLQALADELAAAHGVRAMIEVMVTGLTELSHRFGSGMAERGWGRIINVSSLAAFAPNSPGMLYTGIKSYVLNMSQALDLQLKPSGVHVTALCPGFTWTEFHDTQGTREWANRLPGFLWQDAGTVVRAGWEAVSAGHPVCVPGVVNKAVASFTKHLPERLRYLFGRQARMVQ